MEELLLAMAAEIRIIPGLRDRDVFITPHENFMPSGVRPPCVGIKDGQVKRVELSGGEILETMTVVCVAMVASDSAGSVVGTNGVLALVGEIDAMLDENLLSLPGLESAWSPHEDAVQLFASDNKKWLVKKNINYEYIRTRQRGV